MTRLPKRGTPEHRVQNRGPSGGNGTGPDPRDHSLANRGARDLSKAGLFQVTDEERELAEAQRQREEAARLRIERSAKALHGVNATIAEATKALAKIGETFRGLGGLVVPPEIVAQMIQAGIVPADPPEKES